MTLLPSLGSSASVGRLPTQSASMPTLPSHAQRGSRSTLDAADPLERLRPPTEGRVRRLKYNMRPSSRGLSMPVRNANAELASTFNALVELERPAHLDEPMAAKKALPPIGGGLMPNTNWDHGKATVDDIQTMLKEMNTLYSGAKAGAPAPPPPEKKEEPKKEQAKKAPRRAAAPPKEAPAPGLSRITSRSEAKLYVHTMMQKLREDDMERAQFMTRIDAMVADEKKGNRPVIMENKMAVAGPSAAYVDTVRQRMHERSVKQQETTLVVNERKELIIEERVGAIVAKLDRWEEARQRRLRREARAGVTSRQVAWLHVISLLSRTQKLGDTLVRHRTRKVELSSKITASKSLSIAWRMFIFRKRLKALWKIRTTVRPLLFWWHFNFNIRKKRRAATTILDYLAARQRLGQFNHYVKLYVHSVRKVQAAWRSAWKVLSSQMEISRMLWLLADEKRGLSATGAQYAEQQERSYRLTAIREDLRSRKAAFSERMKKYKRDKIAYDEWVKEEAVYAEARALLGLATAPAAASADGTTGDDAYDKQHGPRKPPLRPVFTLSAGPDHWQRLGEKVAQRRQAEQRARDREWAKQDSMRMEAELGKAPTKKQSTSSLFKDKGGGGGDSPGPNKAPSNAVSPGTEPGGDKAEGLPELS